MLPALCFGFERSALSRRNIMKEDCEGGLGVRRLLLTIYAALSLGDY
jgi:hypothetical protein